MDIAHKLRYEGYKVTPQRVAIYEVLHGRTDHPTAETIYRELHEENPTMSLATIYKTMDIFAKIGLVQIINVGNDSCRYDWDTHEHSHLVCTCCHRVDDLDGLNISAMVKTVEEISGYKIHDHHLLFDGLCPACCKAQSH